MFEREINQHKSKSAKITTNSIFEFNHMPISKRSTLQWAEHCSECSMPHCFETCSFYNPRPDLKCRRFKQGLKIIRDQPLKQIFEVEFSKWGKLEAVGAQSIYSYPLVYIMELTDRVLGIFFSIIPCTLQMRLWLFRKLYGLKNIIAKSKKGESIDNASHMLLQIYNPDVKTVHLRLAIINIDSSKGYYQKEMELKNGFQQFLIDLSDITINTDLSRPYICQIEPTSDELQTRLHFGQLDFVRLQDETSLKIPNVLTVENQYKDKKHKIKCVVWDLDNTLWRGTLIEDGYENLIPNEKAIDLIKTLDQRGILNSIASKNYHEDAWGMISMMGLSEYFIAPQINWGPKSISLEKIQKTINISMDAIAFIDDQIFERAEVESKHPTVTLYNELEISTIAALLPFDVPITEESKMRRQMYKEQTLRSEALGSSDDNYDIFLKNCEIIVSIEALSERTIMRSFELAQRTNQMNFSGKRYSTDELRSIRTDTNKRADIIRCKDKFGDYGIIGLCITNKKTNTIEDMMFSCRIQSKQIDVAVIIHYLETMDANLCINYCPSPRNAKSAQVFSELGFIANEKQNKIVYQFPMEKSFPTNDIITVDVEEISGVQ